MSTVKVTFEDGRSLTTDINGTREEILAYYFGPDAVFNFGDTDEHPADDLRRVVAVQFLDPLDPMVDVMLRVKCDENSKNLYTVCDRCPVAEAINKVIQPRLFASLGAFSLSFYHRETYQAVYHGSIPDHHDQVYAAKDFILAVQFPAEFLIGA